MRNEITHVKKVLTPEECQAIIDDQLPRVQQGLVGGGLSVAKKVRKSQVSFIRGNHHRLRPLIKRIHNIIIDIAWKVHQTEITFFEDAQFTAYKPIGFYKGHVDVQTGPPKRTISATIELSNPKDYIGGGITIHNHPKAKVQPRTQGSLITFPSLMLHEANTVWWGNRYSLVIWGLERHPSETDPKLPKWKNPK
jgi:predicted 2-oxoglutarate/Fe(II)-dependent dioxygenase YbiX